MTKKKIALIVLSAILVFGLFIASCTCVYQLKLNQAAFWWSWFLIAWISGWSVGGYLFYKPNRTEETKTFWLLILILLPVWGAFIALIYNYKLKTYYGQPNNDHSKLQATFFRAKKSIKIYTNSFFVTNDTYKTLNYARWKNVKIELIISVQKKQSWQDFLVSKLQKSLEDDITLYFTNKEITSSFIIVDDKFVLKTPKNFNFKYIYSEKLVELDREVTEYQRLWYYDLERCSEYSLVRQRINPFRKIKYKLVNIFYPFL